MSSNEPAWFKSSYSGSDGDSCVEVALTWRKSSYSGSQGDPAAWSAFITYAADRA